MAILTPTLPQLGRIRAGDTQTMKGGDTRPNRLERWRLTSDNKPRLEYAVTLGWGEEVLEWPDAPEGRQWQLYCTVESLTVVVPHMAALSQCDELWQGSECVYRCDGVTVLKSTIDGSEEGGPCQCDTFAERPATVTRVNLYLPELPGIGVWRLDTRGFYAGSELQAVVAMLSDATASGMPIKADLAISYRKRRSGGQTRIFPVPTLQPHEMTMAHILRLDAPQRALPLPTDAEVYGLPEPTPSSELIDPEQAHEAAVVAVRERLKKAMADGLPHTEFMTWIKRVYNVDSPRDLPTETLRGLAERMDAEGIALVHSGPSVDAETGEIVDEDLALPLQGEHHVPAKAEDPY